MLELSLQEIPVPNGENKTNISRSFVLKTKLEGIRSFREFLELEIKDKKYFRKHLTRLQEKLFRIQDFLESQSFTNSDPIQYLGYLYFDESLSVRDISKRLNDAGITYADSSLNHTFTEIFGWILRDNFDPENEITQKKNSSKIKRNQNVFQGKKESIKSQKRSIVQKVEELLDHTLEQDLFEFNMREYTQLSTPFEKIKYVFDIYYDTSVYDTIELLKNEGFKAPTIATLINSLCRQMLIIHQEGHMSEFPETSKNAITYILNKKAPN